MPEAIENNDPAPTNLSEDLSAAWDAEVESSEVDAPELDAQDAPEDDIEDEAIEEVAEIDEGTDEETLEADEDEPAEEESLEGLVAPEHWAKADREMFEALDDEAKEFVNRRYASMEKDYHSKTQKAATSIRFTEQINEMLSPYKEKMNLAGIDEVTAIKKLAAAQDLLERDPKAGIEHLAKSYGVDLDEVDVEYDEVDPKIAALEAKIQQLEGGLNSTSLEAQNAAIEQFRGATDSNGNLLHPHFDDVYDDMVTLVKSRVASDLDGAYQKAIWSNDGVRDKLLTSVENEKKQARIAANAKKAAAAKRAAKTNIKGNGDPMADAGKDLTLQQELEKNYDNM